MQVARNGDRRGRQLVLLDVVTALERDARLRRQIDAAVEADRLRNVLFIAFGRIISPRYGVVDRVVETEVPRQREVVIGLGHVLPSQYGVHVAVGVVERVHVFGRNARDVVDGAFRTVLTRFEGVAERPARRFDTSRKEELVVQFSVGGQLVEVERRREVDAEVAEQRGAERDGDGRESHRVGQKVIRTAEPQLVDQFDLLDA